MNNADILRDFRRRYEHSYLHVEDPSTKEQNLFYLESVTEDPNHIGKLSLVSDELGKININMGSEHTLKFLPVPVGVFQHGKLACYCLRIPKKQYCRGICPDNTQIIDVTRGLTRAQTRFNWEVVSNAFKKKSYNFKEALNLLTKGDYLSVALKDNYAISLSTTRADGLILLFWDTPIALLKNTGEVLQVLEKVYTKNILEITK